MLIRVAITSVTPSSSPIGRTISSPDADTSTTSRPGRLVLADQRGGLGVHVRVDQLVQRLGHDLLDLLDLPALAQRGQVVAGARHGLLVGAAQPEHQLGVRGLHHVAAADQAVTIERPSEGQRAGLGDDGLVEIEEGGAAAHGPKV